MWIAAILGTATKYAECMLAIKYREVSADGHVLGGGHKLQNRIGGDRA